MMATNKLKSCTKEGLELETTKEKLLNNESTGSQRCFNDIIYGFQEDYGD